MKIIRGPLKKYGFDSMGNPSVVVLQFCENEKIHYTELQVIEIDGKETLCIVKEAEDVTCNR